MCLTVVYRAVQISTFSMVVAAVVEVVRLHKVCALGLENSTDPVPMSVFCLVPQYFIIGAAEIMVNIGTLEMFYSEVCSAFLPFRWVNTTFCSDFRYMIAAWYLVDPADEELCCSGEFNSARKVRKREMPSSVTNTKYASAEGFFDVAVKLIFLEFLLSSMGRY